LSKGKPYIGAALARDKRARENQIRKSAFDCLDMSLPDIHHIVDDIAQAMPIGKLSETHINKLGPKSHVPQVSAFVVLICSRLKFITRYHFEDL
jgi:hypothetical protein